MGYKSLILPQKKDEDLPDGLILIGGKNSHGKSTILEGIIFTFFGPGAFKGKKASSFITYGESSTEIYIYFTLDDNNYFIYRKCSRSGSSLVKLFSFNRISNKYEEIKRLNIEEFFEITQQQALSTVFVKQGEIEELASKKGATVRDMILKLFRLDIIDKTLDFLAKQKSNKEDLREKLREELIPIPRIEEEIKDLKKEIKDNEQIIKNKQKEKQQNEKKLKELPSQKILSHLDNLHNQYHTNKEKFESNKSDFEKKIKDTEFNAEDPKLLDKLTECIKEHESSKVDLEQHKNEVQSKLDSANQQKGSIQGSIKDDSGKISKMEKSLAFSEEKGKGQVAKCPLCQNELSKEHYEEIMIELQQNTKKKQGQLQIIKRDIENYEELINEYTTKLDNIKSVQNNLNNIKDDYANFYKYQEDLEISQKNLEEFREKHKDMIKDVVADKISELSLMIQTLDTELKSIDETISEKVEKNKNNMQKITEKEEEIKKIQELEKKIDEIDVDLTHITKVKEFVRRFVTEYMVTKRLIKNIRIKAEKYIRNFTIGQYGDLLIDLEGSTKTGLALKVKDHFNGVYESTEMISGGDRTSLGMALRLAISELMKIIRPTKDSPKNYPKIDFLLLDEPLAALDEDRRERILSYLIKSDIFPQIFLITHTAIPTGILTHRIYVTKNQSTGLSSARFERQTPVIEEL